MTSSQQMRQLRKANSFSPDFSPMARGQSSGMARGVSAGMNAEQVSPISPRNAEIELLALRRKASVASKEEEVASSVELSWSADAPRHVGLDDEELFDKLLERLSARMDQRLQSVHDKLDTLNVNMTECSDNISKLHQVEWHPGNGVSSHKFGSNRSDGRQTSRGQTLSGRTIHRPTKPVARSTFTALDVPKWGQSTRDPCTGNDTVGTGNDTVANMANLPKGRISHLQKSDTGTSDMSAMAGRSPKPVTGSERDERKPSTATSHSLPSDVLGELIALMARVRPRSEFSKKTWLFLDEPETTFGGTYFKWLMASMTVLSAIIPVVQTTKPAPIGIIWEGIMTMILDGTCTGELLVRFAVCPNFVAFCVNTYSLIDVLAGPVPLLVRVFAAGGFWARNLGDVDTDSVAFFLICCVPVLRLSRLLRRFDAFHLLYKAMILSLEALPVLLFVLSIIVLTFSALIYTVEYRVGVIDSMPKSMWLTIVTVGTVGYGDIVPATPWGHCIVSALVMVSVLYMAIPIGVVGHIWSEVWSNRDRLLLAYTMRRRFVSVGYSAKDVPAMFVSFDLDGDGMLTLKEFWSMMTRLQIDLSGARVVELFAAFDQDGNGTVDDREFVKALFPSDYARIYGDLELESGADEDYEVSNWQLPSDDHGG